MINERKIAKKNRKEERKKERERKKKERKKNEINENGLNKERISMFENLWKQWKYSLFTKNPKIK